MSLYNLSINQKGLKAITSEPGVLSFLIWIVQSKYLYTQYTTLFIFDPMFYFWCGKMLITLSLDWFQRTLFT